MHEKDHVNLPWVEKYRPNALQELISHEDIISTIRLDAALLSNLRGIYSPHFDRGGVDNFFV